MELNAEQIKKALECCSSKIGCKECPLKPRESVSICITQISKYALSLIKELTEENKAWQKQLISTEEQAGKAYYDLACEVENLRAENERLHASCTELERKCASLNEDNERLRGEKEAENKELFYKWKKLADETADRYEGLYQDAKKALVADTVRKMHSMLCEGRVSNDNVVIVANQIAKEMLEENNND